MGQTGGGSRFGRHALGEKPGLLQDKLVVQQGQSLRGNGGDIARAAAHILVGKVDLLLGGDGRLELLDFKASERSTDPVLLATYEDQLCTYAHVLEQRYGKRPERLLLYWTAEADKSTALMEMPYVPEKVEAAGRRFDNVVAKIKAREFRITSVPEAKICKECDLKMICHAEGIISREARG